jgi:hypothetical protein
MPRRKLNGAVGHSSIIYEMEVSAQLFASRKLDSPILFLTKEGRPSAQLQLSSGI